MNRGPHPVHPSSLKLEQLLAGHASPELASHLVACDDCRDKLAAMERAAKAYSASPSSLRAKDAAKKADRRWKQRAAGLVLAPVALAAVLLLVPTAPHPDPLPRGGEGSPRRQAREFIEARGGATSTRLRSIPLRGRNVEFGQGALEASAGDGAARPFTLEHTKVNITVTGFMQAVTVTQTFGNPFSTPVEAVYVFPLPDDAAVHDMELKAGPRIIRAQVQKRAQARATYEQAKAEGRRAALLDQERPNIFTQSLANLLPGERVEVTLSYVAPLRYDDGVYTLNFPMVVGPRYVPGAALPGDSQGRGTTPDTDAVPDASRLSPPAARSGRDIEVHVRLDAGTVIEDLWSVSHRLEVDRPSSAVMNLDLDPLDTLPNKDLIVRWRVSGPQARAAMLAGGGAFALMLNPEAKSANAPVMPRELVFVIDTSCSMNGAPLAAAKRAMTMALEQLQPTDTFSLIDFASTASSFHPEPLTGTPDNVRRATAYLQRLPAGGGTNQLAGIRAALARDETPGRLRLVLLMTDGFIGNEEEILAETRRLRGGARVFGFGIGSSVNHYLLSRLSEEGRGFYQYVRPDEDATEAVTRFARRIERPLISDLSLDWGGLEVADTLPAPLVDLFDAQPVIIQGRYRTPGQGTVVVRGTRGGRPVVFEVPVTFPPLESEGRALQMAWARQRVEQLSRVRYNAEPPEVVEQITALGLEYHLVTKYTSLVAVDDVRVANTMPTTVTEPTLTPDQTVVAGQSGVLGALGKVPVGGEAFGTGGLGLRGTGEGGGGLGAGPNQEGSGFGAGGGRYGGYVASGPDLKGKGGGSADTGALLRALGGVAGTEPPSKQPVVVTGKVAKPELGGVGDGVVTTPSVPVSTPKSGGTGAGTTTGSFGVSRGGQLGGAVATFDVSRGGGPAPDVRGPRGNVAVAGVNKSEKQDPGERRPRGGTAASGDDLDQPFGGLEMSVSAGRDPAPGSTSDGTGDFDKASGGGRTGTTSTTAPREVYIPPAPGSAGDGKESRSQADIMNVVLAHKPVLLACVERHRRLQPGVSGVLRMKWRILPNGSVTGVTVESAEFRTTEFARCLTAQLKTWKFPKSSGPEQLITFPFKF